eukprot:g2390.t1
MFCQEQGKAFCNVKVQCIPGEYVVNASRLDASRCAKCAAGSYSTESNANSCTLCASGTYQREQGKTFCNAKVQCIPGYYSAGHAVGCKQCPGGSETAVSMVVFLVVLVLLIVAVRRAWRYARRRWPDKDLTRLTHEMPQVIKLVTGLYQIVGSFHESFNAVPWPESYVALLRYVSAIASFDLFSQPVFACQAAGDTYAKRFLWHTLVVLCVTLVLGVLLLLSTLVKKCERLSTSEEDKAFTAFRSTKGNEWAERHEWRQTVWEPFVVQCDKMEGRFGFLFNAYTNKYYWFESVLTFYKLAMTTLVVFVAGMDGTGTMIKILYSAFMATCLMALIAFVQPYKDADVLSVETMVNLELLFVLFAALYLQISANIDDENDMV